MRAGPSGKLGSRFWGVAGLMPNGKGFVHLAWVCANGDGQLDLRFVRTAVVLSLPFEWRSREGRPEVGARCGHQIHITTVGPHA